MWWRSPGCLAQAVDLVGDGLTPVLGVGDQPTGVSTREQVPQLAIAGPGPDADRDQTRLLQRTNAMCTAAVSGSWTATRSPALDNRPRPGRPPADPSVSRIGAS